MHPQPTPGAWLTGPEIVDHTGRPWREREGVEHGITIPHADTFQSRLAGIFRTYVHGMSDAAIRHDPEFAKALRLDPMVMRPLRERIDSVVALESHLETDDDADPVRRAVRDGVWATILQTSRLEDMISYLLEAIWYGKYGAQLVYEERTLNLPDPKNPKQKIPTVCPVVTNHQPEEGDKFGWMYDATPYMLVNAAAVNRIPNMETIITTAGRAALLKGTVRDRFILHAHERRDAPFQNSDQAASIYGLGVRNTVYWLCWLRQELMSHILEFTERTGLGLRVWFYDANNPQSKAAVEYAAGHQTNRTNLLVPRFRDGNGRAGVTEGVEVVDTSTAGSELLLKILKEYQQQIELYMIGQTLSSGTEGSGLGGSGVADMHGDTKWRLTSLDAKRLAETLTHDWVRKVLAWQYPQHADMPLRWKFSVLPFNAAERLQTIRMGYDMGVDYPKKKVRELTGVSDPIEGDETISLAQQQQQMAAMQPQMPGGVPGDGDSDGVGFEEQAEDPDMDYIGDAFMRNLEPEGAAV